MSESCPICGGDGIYEGETCSYCGGTGTFVRELPSRIFQSYLVLERIDATEHNSLTNAQKNGVLHILACGLVDLNEGKLSRTRIWNWFGEESKTVSNLTLLLGQ